jgi:hexulose-6-phosphate isomerase
MPRLIDRRTLLTGTAASLAATLIPGSLPSLLAAETAAKPKLKKAVKYGMIGLKGTIEERLALARKVGFDGVEMDSPGGPNPEEALAAAKKVGIEIHGVVISSHWNVRHSDPDEKVRAKAFDHLVGALRDAKGYGASTVLLVPGVVKANDPNESFDLVWERSTAAVKKALPVAHETGVKIAIEVVWNNFITTSDQLIKYVDQFNDPFVGAYFDCSNMIKYGEPSATWIRKLGKRMLKFDFKGYNGDTKKWVKIGEGTEDWPEVKKALAEIGYDGWATSEVGGGGEDKLREIKALMDKVLD